MALVQTATWPALLLAGTLPLHAQPPADRDPLVSAFRLADEIRREASPVGDIPRTIDIKVAVHARGGQLPVPMLTLTHSYGQDIEPDLFVWWVVSPYLPESEFPQRRRCTQPGPGAVCVASIPITRSVDWPQLLVDVYASRVCTLRLDSSTVFSLMTHTVDLRVSIQEFRPAPAQQAFSCVEPRGSTRAGAAEATRTMDLLTQLADDARRAGW